MNRFEISDAIRYGWNTVKANLGLFVVVAAIMLLLSGGGERVAKNAPFLNLVTGILNAVLSLGVTYLVLKFVDGGKGEFNDLFSQFDILLRYIGASILFGLIVAGGLILLIVPGIIWAIKFGFFGFIMVDKRTGIRESLRLSGELTRGARGDLFIFYLALIGVNLLGALCLGVGLLVTMPLTWLAGAYVYRKLSKEPGAVMPEPGAEPMIR